MKKRISPAASKLLASTLTMLLALMLAAGATFAWFTISTNPEISGIQVSLGGWENLLIARDDPEVDPLDLDYKTTIHLNDIIPYYSDLTPVSTADLKNWFIPAYNSTTGALRPVEEFTLDPDLSYANSFIVETENGEVLFRFDGTTSSAIPLSGVQLLNAQKKGYYVYADFWLKTEEKEGTDVYLSFPHYGAAKAAAANELDGYFGTYVLPTLQAKVDVTGETVLSPKQYNSECAIRLGFAVYDDGRNSETWRDWFIFEPNADKRSVMEEKPALQSEYIIDYIKSTAEYSSGLYVKTSPIGYTGSEDWQAIDAANSKWSGIAASAIAANNTAGIKAEYTAVTDISSSASAVYYIESSAGVYKSVTGAQAYALKAADPGQQIFRRSLFRRIPRAVDVPESRMIVQMAGAWKTDSPSLMATLLNGGRLNSREVSYFGNFVTAQSLNERLAFLRASAGNLTRSVVCNGVSKLWTAPYEAPAGLPKLQSDSTSQRLLQLNYNEPVRIRLFVWVEGQDVDCWNDIAAGSVQVNLEFSGMTRED